MESPGEQPVDHSYEAPDVQCEEGNDTLKYQLLGPSLTKAGQDAVDQEKVRNASCVLSFLPFFFVCFG